MCSLTKLDNMITAVVDNNATVALGAKVNATIYYVKSNSVPITRYYQITINGETIPDACVGYAKNFDTLCVLLSLEKQVTPFIMKRNPETGNWLNCEYYSDIPLHKRAKFAAKLAVLFKEA